MFIPTFKHEDCENVDQLQNHLHLYILQMLTHYRIQFSSVIPQLWFFIFLFLLESCKVKFTKETNIIVLNCKDSIFRNAITGSLNMHSTMLRQRLLSWCFRKSHLQGHIIMKESRVRSNWQCWQSKYRIYLFKYLELLCITPSYSTAESSTLIYYKPGFCLF